MFGGVEQQFPDGSKQHHPGIAGQRRFRMFPADFDPQAALFLHGFCQPFQGGPQPEPPSGISLRRIPAGQGSQLEGGA